MRIFTCLIILLLIHTAGLSQDRAAQSASSNPGKLIRFYPNPATTFINIEVQRSVLRNASFQVYNFLGKKVVDLQDMTDRTRIDLSSYSRGIYIYQLRDRSGKVIESGKFQVEK